MRAHTLPTTGWADREIETLGRWRGSEAFELSPEADEQRKWMQVELELEGLSLYSDNWDGHGAIAPGADLLMSATELLTRMRNAGNPTPVRILPTSAGGILVEWQNWGGYLEAEIETPQLAVWMRRRQNGSYEHWSTPLSASRSRREDQRLSQSSTATPPIESYVA